MRAITNVILFAIAILTLSGCSNMVPVEGAPEVHVYSDMTSKVTVLPDGDRMVIVSSGKAVKMVVVLPPITPTFNTVPIVDTNHVENVK